MCVTFFLLMNACDYRLSIIVKILPGSCWRLFGCHSQGHCDRGGQGGGGGGSARASRNVCGASARARPRIAHRHARHANTRFSAPRHNSISAAPADQVTHFRPVWMDISLGGKWPWLQQRNRLIKKP